jgi:hypothetical protein
VPVGGQGGEPDALVEFDLEHRVPDGEAPEDADVTGIRFEMGEGADGPLSLGERDREKRG